MAKRIALFNHKGGVSKTTTTFNLGWMLAAKGKRVIIVDADPQSNLTGVILGYKGPSELESFYENESHRNLKAGLAPAFESQPVPMEAVKCVAVSEQEGLYLLPGHIGLSEYEVTLGIAQELSGSIQTLRNLPGSISVLLHKTADKLDADYILVDMNPRPQLVQSEPVDDQRLFHSSDKPGLLFRDGNRFSVQCSPKLALMGTKGCCTRYFKKMQFIRFQT